jgi:hydrogenase maturation protease
MFPETVREVISWKAAAGIFGARRFHERLGGKTLPPRVRAVDKGPAPENSTGLIRREEPDLVVLVDAADFGRRPGAVALIEHGRFESSLPSTHSLPVSAVIRYLEETTAAAVVVLLIQAGSVQLDGPMTRRCSGASKKPWTSWPKRRGFPSHGNRLSGSARLLATLTPVRNQLSSLPGMDAFR